MTDVWSPSEQSPVFIFASSGDFWTLFWSTALGALVGAGAAFALEHLSQRRAERRRRIAAANLALLTMWQMWKEIFNYEKNMLRPQIADGREDIPLWLRTSIQTQRHSDLRIDVPSVVFLLDSKNDDDKARLAGLILQEKRYHGLFDTVYLRNDILAAAHEKMAGHDVGFATDPSDQQLIDSIGIPGIVKLRTITIGLIESVYKNLVDMREEYFKLMETLRGTLGRESIIAFDLEDIVHEVGMPMENWLLLARHEVNVRPYVPPFNTPPPNAAT